MLSEIAQLIQQRIVATGMFRQVLFSANDNHVYQYPSAVIYLAKDVRVNDTPSSRRELTWEILIATKATPATEQHATASVYELLDRVRDDLTDWLPLTKGMQPATVPDIEFVEWQNGVMVYAMQLKMRVIPVAF